MQATPHSVSRERKPVAPSKLPLSIIVLTRDEEVNLPGCLDSLAGVSDDVHVLDSGSTDETVAIARERGVAVHEHPLESFGRQRNWAIDNIPHRYDWVFHLDADERFTPELAAELAQTLGRNPAEAGFYVASKLMFGGSWLRYSGEYPAWQVRLFHRDRLRFVDSGHGQSEQTSGQLGKLQSPYLHYPFAKGLEEWFRKHVRYARLEAEQHGAESASLCSDVGQLIRGPGLARRRAAKRLSYRMPARGLLRMLHLLVWKRGILDGRAGIAYARMKSIYESMAATFAAANELGLAAPGDTARRESPQREQAPTTVREVYGRP
jgi:glycosyltransferase involved in cell wall biosynthesis